GPRDIAEVKSRRVGSIDDTGDMQHRLGARDQPPQRLLVGKIAADPLDPVARPLLAPGQSPQSHTSAASLLDDCLADEAGATGQGDRHSRTNWSRWITAERGA